MVQNIVQHTLPPLPVALLALAGYSTVGKDTLITELAKHYHFKVLSAGHVFKAELMARYGLGPEHVFGNGPLRNAPHPKLPKIALPQNLAAHRQGLPTLTGTRHMSPREAELMLQAAMPVSHVVWANLKALESLLAEGVAVVFNGYRFPEQHAMLGQCKAKLGQQDRRVVRLKLISPQVPEPVPHSRHDDLLDSAAFEGFIWNDKTLHPSAMLRQLSLIVAQMTKAPLF